MYVYENLNQASIGLSKEILKIGIKRKTRGFDCIEIPFPVTVKITNPTDRYINLPGRKASKTLPFYESLAIASGVNDLSLYSGVVPNMKQYSDDGVTQRAGYGPRIRRFEGNPEDYEVFEKDLLRQKNSEKKNVQFFDQLKYVVEILKKDKNTRQAAISITDPAKDQLLPSGELKSTKDIPCCRLLQFQVSGGKLDLISYFRSNDLIYGFQQVNVFNNCFILEYVSMMVDLPIGNYYHTTANLHFYEDKRELVEHLASLNPDHFKSEFGVWEYKEKFSLQEFDSEILNLIIAKKKLKEDKESKITRISDLEDFQERFFFLDWLKTIFRFEKTRKTYFKNPYLNKLFKLEKFSSEVKIVMSDSKKDGIYKPYAVYNPPAYISKCESQGNMAYYAGVTDNYGYLNQ